MRRAWFPVEAAAALVGGLYLALIVAPALLALAALLPAGRMAGARNVMAGVGICALALGSVLGFLGRRAARRLQMPFPAVLSWPRYLALFVPIGVIVGLQSLFRSAGGPMTALRHAALVGLAAVAAGAAWLVIVRWLWPRPEGPNQAGPQSGTTAGCSLAADIGEN